MNTSHNLANESQVPTPLGFRSRIQNVYPLIRSSDHFSQRSSERGLPHGVLDYILRWSNPVYRSGEIFLTLRWKDLPESEVATAMAKRAMGWVIVRSHDGFLITCYWNRNAVGHLKKKPRNSLSKRQFEERVEGRSQRREEARFAKKAHRKISKLIRFQMPALTPPSAA